MFEYFTNKFYLLFQLSGAIGIILGFITCALDEQQTNLGFKIMAAGICIFCFGVYVGEKVKEYEDLDKNN